MTIWYSALAFALVLGATGFLYWVLIGNLEREDARILANTLQNTRLLLGTAGPHALPPASQNLQQQSLVYLRILGADGRVLLETPELSRELPPPTAAELERVNTSKGDVGQTLVSPSGRLFQVLTGRARNVDTSEPPLSIQVAIDRDSERHILAQYRERMWLVLGLSLILCSLIGHGIARSGMRPILHVGSTAERIGSSTLHERIATKGLPAELLGVAEAFNNMLDRLQGSFARVSQFSDDVAHELRTPINNLRGEMEVALGKARSNEDYRDVLGSCLEECARISRVIESLLFLARSESSSEPLKRELVDIGKELAAVGEFYEPAAADAGVRLHISVDPNLSAHVDRILLQQAIGNLISNAISHTPHGGSVEVSARAEGSELSIRVADTGCGIPAEHLPHIFDRFYRVDRARSGTRQNVGLGLAVVKSIVTRHYGRIEIISDVGRGTTATLVLPSE